MKFNLGAADRHLDGFLCIDLYPPACAICGAPAGRRVDLTEVWPFGNSSVEEVMALDLVEHIGNGYRLKKTFAIVGFGFNTRKMLEDVELVPFNGKVHFFNELHRVLVPGGRVTIETPDAAPTLYASAGYFQDPTHVSPFTRNSFQYFGAGPGGDYAYSRLAKAYGINGRFNLIEMSQSAYQDVYDPVVKLKVVLEAVKPRDKFGGMA